MHTKESLKEEHNAPDPGYAATDSSTGDIIPKGLARYTANFTVPAAGTSTLTDKTHSYTVTHDSSANQLSVTSDSPMATIKVRIATA